MRTIVKSAGFKLTSALADYVELKVGSLAKFLKKFEKSGLQARVEVAKTTKHHRRGNVFRAEINLRLPGELLRAEYYDVGVRQAINKAKEKMKGEIIKYKERVSVV